MDDALVDFEAFLRRCDLTEDNIGKCIRFAQKLALGKGLNYRQRNGCIDFGPFLPGVAVDLRACDFDKLILEAKEWVPPSADKSNGWLYNHQLQKLRMWRKELRVKKNDPTPDLLEYYATEMEGANDQPGESTLLAVEAATVDPPGVPVTRRRILEKPSGNTKSLRTLGNCSELRKYLKNGAGSASRKRRDYTKVHTPLLIQKVKEWLLLTEEGRERLEGCKVDKEGFAIDHAWAQALGGPDVLENYHVMPSNANSYFGDMAWNVAEKAEYLGDEQINLVRTLAKAAQRDFPWSDSFLFR